MTATKILQQNWQTQSLQQKFLAYKQAYFNTGYISFPALKTVAFMAQRGTVFTPDKARQIITPIQSTATRISQLVEQMQAEIAAISSYSAHLDHRLQAPLRDLSKHIISLTQSIEKEIMSIVGLASSEHDKLEQHFAAMNYARTYLLERLIIDIEAAQTGNSRNLQRVNKYLTSIDSSAYELATIAQQVIKQRIPFNFIH